MLLTALQILSSNGFIYQQAEKLKSREMKDVEECRRMLKDDDGWWRMMVDDGGKVEWLIDTEGNFLKFLGDTLKWCLNYF